MTTPTHVKLRHVGDNDLTAPWQVTLPEALHAAGKPIAEGTTVSEAWRRAEEYVDGPIRLFPDGEHEDVEAQLVAAGIDTGLHTDSLVQAQERCRSAKVAWDFVRAIMLRAEEQMDGRILALADTAEEAVRELYFAAHTRVLAAAEAEVEGEYSVESDGSILREQGSSAWRLGGREQLILDCRTIPTVAEQLDTAIALSVENGGATVSPRSAHDLSARLAEECESTEAAGDETIYRGVDIDGNTWAVVV